MTKRLSKKPQVIAIVNSSEDVVEALEALFQEEGYNTVGAHVTDFKKGRKNLLNFFTTHKPDAVIWDIAPPYNENWNYLQQILAISQIKKLHFVITTTNIKRLQDVAGDVTIHEIVGKPFDLEEIVNAVKKKLQFTSSQDKSDT